MNAILTHLVLVAAAITIPVDARLVGTWETSVTSYLGTQVYSFSIAPSGAYSSGPKETTAVAPESGFFESAGGSWRLTSAGGKRDRGTYEVLAPDRIRITGQGGALEWARISDTATVPVPAGADGIPMEAVHGVTAPPVEPDHATERALALEIATRWNGAARPMRTDVCADYSGSRYTPRGVRHVFFVPGQPGRGLEVFLHEGRLHARPYGILTQGDAPREIPEGVLSPDAALRRLFTLSPTVPADRVYLQLLWPGIEQALPVQGGERETELPAWFFLTEFPSKDRVAELDPDATNMPRERPVWRMLALHDVGAPWNGCRATFVAIDAATGVLVTPVTPGIRGISFLSTKVPDGSAVRAADPAAVPLDGPETVPVTHDPLAALQQAEALTLGLRSMVGGDDAALGKGLDRVKQWSERVTAARSAFAARGLDLLDIACQAAPGDVALHARRATACMDALWKERKLDGVARTDTGRSSMGRARDALAALEAIAPDHPALAVQRMRMVRVEEPAREVQYPVVKHAARADPDSGYARAVMAVILATSGRNLQEVADETRLLEEWTEYSSGTYESGDYIYSWSKTVHHKIAPDAGDRAQAHDLEARSRDHLVRATMYWDHAMKAGERDPEVFFLYAMQNQEHRPRLARLGLRADPAHAGLHRLLSPGNPLAAFFDAPRTAAECVSKADEMAGVDLFLAVCAARQAVRLEPAGASAHLALGTALSRASGGQAASVELIPDALEQAQRELAIASRLAERAGDTALAARADSLRQDCLARLR